MAKVKRTGSGRRYKISPHDLELVAVESNPVTRARERIFDVDTAMRANYDALKTKVSANLDTVIVVQPDLGGGTYTLICRGTQTTVHPVDPLFQMVKSVCHLPLGIYAILAPYLKGAGTREWIPGLTAFREIAATARDNLSGAGLPPKSKRASDDILSEGIRFMDRCIARADFSIDEFRRFSTGLHKSIITNMGFAAGALIKGVEGLLAKWRKEIGEDSWKDLYVVILVIWTTESQNQHYEILRRILYQKTVDERLIVIGVGEQEPDMLPVALDNLARIVQDNVAAGLILPTDDELAETLAGPKDLLADAVDKAMAADKAMQSCPHGGPRRPREPDLEHRHRQPTC